MIAHLAPPTARSASAPVVGRALFLGNAYHPLSIACALAAVGAAREVIVAVHDPVGAGLGPLRTLRRVWRTQGGAAALDKTGLLLRARGRSLARRIGLRPRGYASLDEVCRAYDLTTIACRDANDPAFVEWVRGMAVDLVIVANFSRILRRPLLEAPAMGCLNVHPSLLPKYRGPHPLFWALANGERTTGVTVHVLTERIDAGPVVLQRALRIQPRDDERALLARCARVATELLPEAMSLVASGQAVSQPQNENEATYYPARRRRQRVAEGRP